MAITTKIPSFLILLIVIAVNSVLGIDELFDAVEERERDPHKQHQYQQCREQCQHQQGGAKHECQQRCKDRYGYGIILLKTYERRDPEKECQQCQQQSHQQQGKQQQQQCQQLFQEHYGQQQQDSQREYQLCQQQCRQQQKQCQQRFQEGHQQHDDALMNTEEQQGPEREYQECQQKCHQQPGQQRECRQRCEVRYAQQRQQRDPQRLYQQVQQQCHQQQSHRQQQQCQQLCQKEYGRQQPNPEKGYQQCQQECHQQEGRREQQQLQPEKQCQQFFEEQCGEQQEDPERQYQQCPQQQGQQHRRRQERCERLEEKQGSRGYEYEQGSRREQRGLEEDENPYFFGKNRFVGYITSQEGNIRVLERFGKRSDLLEVIDNYRVGLVDANPNTVLTPHHMDADLLCVVLNGRGSITSMQQHNKETHNIEHGDIFRIPAGNTAYAVNRDNKERLYVAGIIVPVNTPGEFEPFFAPGGRDQESFFNAFSDEVLQAAFNTESGRLRRMFQGQNKGRFVKASQQQIRSLSSQSSEHGVSPSHHGGDLKSRRPYNLFNQRPTQSNRYGQLYEANPDDYQQLQELDLTVSFENITRGAMIGPYYNSRSTKLAMVVSGEGYFEMACPHLNQQHGGRSSQRGYHGSRSTSYQRVSARVSRGDVFVVPAGHPIVTVASGNQNLQLLCFATNALDNQRNQLAGTNNIMKQLDRVAKELSFNIPAKEVEKILNRQQESVFFPGPNNSINTTEN